MNLPITGPADPRDDTHEKEDISPSREILLRRQECLHSFEEEENGLLACRHCGHRERLDESPTDYSNPETTILIKIPAVSSSSYAIKMRDLSPGFREYVASEASRGVTRSTTCRSGG